MGHHDRLDKSNQLSASETVDFSETETMAAQPPAQQRSDRFCLFCSYYGTDKYKYCAECGALRKQELAAQAEAGRSAVVTEIELSAMRCRR